jgi:hypothetical protein
MTVLIAPWLGLLMGLAFAWAAREALSRSERGHLASPALLMPVAFGLLVLGPSTGYFLAYASDWSFAYLVDSQRLPAMLEMLSLFLVASTPTLGFILSSGHASRREGGPLLRLASGISLVILVTLLSLGHRLAVDANFAQYHGSFGTHSVAGGSLGLSLLWMTSIVFLSGGWVCYQLKRLGQKARD